MTDNTYSSEDFDALEQLRLEMNRHLTLGENRVRLGFNPSGNDLVDDIKAKTATLIDLCDQELTDKDPRLADAAMICFENAAMWAVKAATA